MQKLQEQQKNAFRDAEAVVFDLDDTLINGNASYGAFLTVKDRLKKGKKED